MGTIHLGRKVLGPDVRNFNRIFVGQQLKLEDRGQCLGLAAATTGLRWRSCPPCNQPTSWISKAPQQQKCNVYLNVVETVLTAPDLLSGKFQTRFVQIILMKFNNLITNTVAKVQVHTYRLIYFWTPYLPFPCLEHLLSPVADNRGVPRILPGGDAHFWLTYSARASCASPLGTPLADNVTGISIRNSLLFLVTIKLCCIWIKSSLL